MFFCKNFKNTFFRKTPSVAASVNKEGVLEFRVHYLQWVVFSETAGIGMKRYQEGLHRRWFCVNFMKVFRKAFYKTPASKGFNIKWNLFTNG